MLQRIEREERHAPSLAAIGLTQPEPIVPAVAEAELETTPLPHDHPKWAKDTLTISQRARDIIGRLKPVIVRILTFWDHRLRSISIGDKRVNVDPSGSYRVD